MKDTGNALANFMGPQEVNLKIMFKFIKTYESLPELWDPKNSLYNIKTARNAAYDILLKILKKWNPAATRNNVRRKINCLRVNYRKELKRFIDSKVVEADGTETFEYVPKQWKFHALKFLSKNDKDQNVVEFLSAFSPKLPMDTDDDYNIPMPRRASDMSDSNLSDSDSSHNQFEDRTTKREYEAIGANVALKLQRMSSNQRYHAELLINKVLINGLKNNLTDDTVLTDLQVLDVKHFHEP